MNLRLHIFFGQLLWLISVLNGKSFQGIPGYGRNLVIKAIPAVEDYQSDLYEVFMEPYFYELGTGLPVGGDRSQKQIELATPRPGLRAIVHLRADQESEVDGDLVFTQVVPNGPVTIEGNITGLPAGLHGLHVHHSGDIKDNCQEIGPHFIAYYGRHGGPRDSIRHVGDLGNIKAEENTPLNVKIFDHLISLTGPRSIVGRSIAITKSEDDYGRAGTEDSALTGTSGPAIACGVIGYLN
ncbi:superoxide dismutase [Cu-Zn]-like [Bicyclus anynana]|uniref:superoxide dismutase n=1 Tax=Bicyclus anynana TaxID=110368 RepID=A0ABM3LFL6_BICAN|nr:superoxide dismutase [Cu-Zn]-like [Bicyclus anynana]XP_052737848.1 superoxide dismutase [Cu-Zn]-like [Bicyclus anynana]XP_052737849.1 superoxide dismutase [Cu-Zn]-like [Bicyclus anynana]XP_052737850.1 superoxide dismutase [Cu-Zn]-like [Bicyclus anynana]XP_052737851.1 superoxide dismutase [Cu-Zn]-like [Bicyclus anynana]XP_052737853.1 superoxide dismutase [Cu-Zn]-like [Bicyclus anynana]XP_052737854.1 superoxide dismutase [Cu-Zn]-like [Bicyclus anynana]